MTGLRKGELVLAICPFSRGIAFTLFEGPLSPIDWGIKEVRTSDRNTKALAVAIALIERLQPDVVVLEDYSRGHGHKSPRVRRLHRLIANYADGQAIEVIQFSKAGVRLCFADVGARTRYEIAQSVAARVHALSHRLPPVRRIWMSEDPRMSLFDAAAIAMAYFATARISRKERG